MAMTVRRISDLVKTGAISVKDTGKGFTIRDLVEGYMRDSDDGSTTDSVFGYDGKLNIRPSYQRNSVYNTKKRDAVIETILDECPLNVIYWVDNEDGTYEVLDGQQRILSICKYVAGEFAVSADCFPTDIPQDFPNLLANINPNNSHEEPLLSGSWNRQDYLSTALLWAAKHEGFSGDDAIEQYMLKHRGDADASALWQYFSMVLEWVRSKFVSYNKALKGIDWGNVCDGYHLGAFASNIISLSGAEINDRIVELISDDEVTCSMKGIYMYVITGDGKYLSIRQFDEKTARSVYEKQKHHCPYCEKEGNLREYAFKEMHADHIKPWSKGGKTVEDNCQMLCRAHNETKGNRW